MEPGSFPPDAAGASRTATRDGPNHLAALARRGAWATISAILGQRCPRCHTGRIFRGAFAMNDPCPVCGLLFQREAGYFLGAMYISYGIAVVILTTLFFTAAALLSNWNYELALVLAMVVYILFVPVVFRYSRVLWIYFDRSRGPGSDLLMSSYEKWRLQELQGGKTDPPASYRGQHPS